MTISQEDYETETGQKRTILFTILVNTERFNIHLMVKTLPYRTMIVLNISVF